MSSKYQIWLTYNGEAEKVRLPVLPEAIKIKDGNSNKSVSIQGLGEVVIKQDPSAVVISFSSFFPAQPFPGVQVENLTPPEDLIEKIREWKNSNLPIHLIITGTKINMFCAVESFEYGENGGDVGTLNYSISLKQYREVTARQVNIKDYKASIEDNSNKRIDNRAQEKTHTVVKGDCLWNISKKHLGKSERWKEIYNLNKDKIKNPNLIYPGQVLRLPT